MTRQIPLLDCHQHLIYPDQFTYSWTDQNPVLAGTAFELEQYRQLVEPHGPVRSIFMEASPDDRFSAAESRFVMKLADLPNTIIDGLILSCRPETDHDFLATIESMHHPKLVGFRRILHVAPDELSTTPQFRDNVNLLARYGLTFDVCVSARQLPIAYELIRACPNVQFVLDHCGMPDIATGALGPWREDLSRLARLPNLACKISGVLTYCQPGNATAEAVRPYVEHCIEQFSWDRVVWGGDWPVINKASTLPNWIEISRKLVRDEPISNQHKLFHLNAERIYLGR